MVSDELKFIFDLPKHLLQFEPAPQFRRIQLAGFPARQRSAFVHPSRRPDGSMRSSVSPLGVLSDRKPPRPPARPFRRERLHGQARFRAMSRRSCAIAKPQLELVQCNPVYSPQRSTNSATVHALFSTPAACAGVMRIAPWNFTKL